MAIRLYRAYSPGTRSRSSLNLSDLFKGRPEKSLTRGKNRCNGRNNRGVITVKGRGGGHKRKYREVDFARSSYWTRKLSGYDCADVLSIEYDPSRNARIAKIAFLNTQVVEVLEAFLFLSVFLLRGGKERQLLGFTSEKFFVAIRIMKALGFLGDLRLETEPGFLEWIIMQYALPIVTGKPHRLISIRKLQLFTVQLLGLPLETKKYIIAPRSLKVGAKVYSGADSPIEIGNALPLQFIPLGSIIHNVELTLGKGGQAARAAGTYAQLIAREGNFVTLKLPSREVRLVNKKCYATVGQVGNMDFRAVTLGKAGRKRWLGKRPKVRGVVKNPIDHPHGGGEGKSPIGHEKPLTPWGKPALGVKTRKVKKASNNYILRGRR